MRKTLLLLVAAATLAVTGAAVAATATVTITKAGYVPNATTIAQGDSVQFTNSDTAAHQVVFKTTAGVACSLNPLVLQPAQSGTCTFQSAGSYTYSDPNAKGNTFRGTITVNALGESLTLAASAHRVLYGGHVTLSGTLSTQKAGENVDVLALQCGASAATKVATVQTTTNGAYSVVVQPLMNTSYTVKVKNTASPATSVTVRPKLRLGKVAPHRYSLRVSAAASFAGKYASFQRYNGSRWVAVRTVLLRANSTGVSPTMLTTASFRSSTRAGVRVRAVLGQAQVGTCYLPGISNTIRS
jgi:plastocyanin